MRSVMLIGEGAKAAGMTPTTLRFYDEQGLLPPAQRGSNGYRQYGGDSVARLDFIARGRAAGLSVSQIRSILAVQEPGNAPCVHVRDVLAGQLAELDLKIAELTALREGVAVSYMAVAAGDPATCDQSRVCSYL
ncbi:heavy metal-responsive transcriptional regulator [Pseudarthrobacter sp. AB1]|nr:heavy metal-responsive transcriptional regulator [Pseudarthrobacter sp. AB1]